MKLQLAQVIAERLLTRFDDSERGCVAGSIRRLKPEPLDIELLLPWHPPEDDPVYRRIKAMCPPSDQDGDLFGDQRHMPEPAETEQPWFRVEKGLKPGFRHAQLLCLAATDERWSKLNAPDFKIDIFRFDLPDEPGTPGGNFGWVLLQRTGPAEFGEACLAHFKRYGGGGSREGYLIDAIGRPIPTLTELDAFRTLRVVHLDPADRIGFKSVRPKHDWHDPIPAEEIPF